MNRKMTFFYLSLLLLVGCKTKKEDLAPVFPDAPAYSDEYRKYLETDSVCFTRLEGNNYLLMGMGASAAFLFDRREGSLFLADTQECRRWYPLFHVSSQIGDVDLLKILPSDCTSHIYNESYYLRKVMDRHVIGKDTIFDLVFLALDTSLMEDSLNTSKEYRRVFFEDWEEFMFKSWSIGRTYLRVSTRRGLLDIQDLGAYMAPFCSFSQRIAKRHRAKLSFPGF